jgi:ABC-2 type transport system ATP-binding protein
MTNTIQVNKVNKNYKHIEALHDFSVEVQQGEIFGLLGANGAGKTTLIKVLIGALKADSGEVNVLGFDPHRQKYELRPQIGYMPQQAALYEDLTARDNVRFFGKAQPIANLEKRIVEVLTFLDLADRADDPVYGFSGGMRQRVSLACALVHEPKLLLLDEPSTGIDPKLRETLWSHFHELTTQGVTILVSTHQMDEALHCSRVAVMRNGQVLACDSPRSLLARGHAQVTIWNSEEAHNYDFDNYRIELPKILEKYSNINKIEIHEDTLEDVVLALISQKETAHD